MLKLLVESPEDRDRHRVLDQPCEDQAQHDELQDVHCGSRAHPIGVLLDPARTIRLARGSQVCGPAPVILQEKAALGLHAIEVGLAYIDAESKIPDGVPSGAGKHIPEQDSRPSIGDGMAFQLVGQSEVPADAALPLAISGDEIPTLARTYEHAKKQGSGSQTEVARLVDCDDHGCKGTLLSQPQSANRRDECARPAIRGRSAPASALPTPSSALLDLLLPSTRATGNVVCRRVLTKGIGEAIHLK